MLYKSGEYKSSTYGWLSEEFEGEVTPPTLYLSSYKNTVLYSPSSLPEGYTAELLLQEAGAEEYVSVIDELEANQEVNFGALGVMLKRNTLYRLKWALHGEDDVESSPFEFTTPGFPKRVLIRRRIR